MRAQGEEQSTSNCISDSRIRGKGSFGRVSHALSSSREPCPKRTTRNKQKKTKRQTKNDLHEFNVKFS